MKLRQLPGRDEIFLSRERKPAKAGCRVGRYYSTATTDDLSLGVEHNKEFIS